MIAPPSTRAWQTMVMTLSPEVVTPSCLRPSTRGLTLQRYMTKVAMDSRGAVTSLPRRIAAFQANPAANTPIHLAREPPQLGQMPQKTESKRLSPCVSSWLRWTKFCRLGLRQLKTYVNSWISREVGWRKKRRRHNLISKLRLRLWGRNWSFWRAPRLKRKPILLSCKSSVTSWPRARLLRWVFWSTKSGPLALPKAIKTLLTLRLPQHTCNKLLQPSRPKLIFSSRRS